ncbi:histidine phosphatase family protein [Hyphomonas sp. WL0036]|uniref:SixA phosphatase family protein n=1 Tax=Hyphomonas sediminis TaxID=2866160 RepID=UPI001C825594|nr:phosphoglycerate mutase family protein [Hyphomonas sediminis]MBY9066361.1 histidine phosphatase family protein [Hyphomonas sediminis]
MAAHLIRRGFLALLAVGLLSACMASPSPAPVEAPAPEASAEVSRLFLVRHGEKETGADPALTAEGAARAQVLAERLAGEGVTEVWSTATRRTQETARPLAQAQGLTIQTYDASALPTFANQLAETPGVKLVVGHSNTTDALAALLGADPGPPIDEAGEFDRLYVITVSDTYQVGSEIQRYGAPFSGGEDTTQ